MGGLNLARLLECSYQLRLVYSHFQTLMTGLFHNTKPAANN